MLTKLTSLFLLATVKSQGDIVCNDAHECSNSVYNNQNIDNIYCNGYESCEDSTLTGDTYVYCDGDYSCVNSTVTAGTTVFCTGNRGCVGADLTSSDNINCAGYYGCVDTTIDAAYSLICGSFSSCTGMSGTVGGNFKLYGANACSSCDITFDASGADQTFYAYGYTAASNAVFDQTDYKNQTTTIDAYGYYALQDATFYSGEGNIVDVYFRGFYAGDGFELYCQNMSTCNVFCYGYSCLDTNVYCDTTATCEIACFDVPDETYCAVSYSTTSDMTSLTKKKNKQLFASHSKNKLKQIRPRKFINVNTNAKVEDFSKIIKNSNKKLYYSYFKTCIIVGQSIIIAIGTYYFCTREKDFKYTSLN